MHMYVSPIVNMSRSNAIKSSIPMNYLFVSFLHPLRQQTPILVVLVLKKKKKKKESPLNLTRIFRSKRRSRYT